MNYSTEHNAKGGFQFDVRNPPNVGTVLSDNFGDRVRFDGIGLAGMLACTRERDGVQNLYMPFQLTVPA